MGITVHTYQRQVQEEAAPNIERRGYATPQLETPPARVVPGAEASGAGFGKTVASIGEQLMAEEKRKQDSIRLLDADTQSGALENQLMYDPNTGALNVKGKASFGLPDKVGKSWDDGVSKIREGLANDDQRLAFDQHTSGVRNRMMQAIDQHIAGESFRVDSDALGGKVENETQAAIADGRPERIQQAVDSVRLAYQDYAERYGVPAEQRHAAQAKAVSRIHLGVISRMLDNNSDIQAKVYYQHVQEEVLPEQRGKVEEALAKATTLGTAQRTSDTVMSGTAFGMVEKGNLNPFDRPILNNETGEVLPAGSDVSKLKDYSTMSTITIEDNKGITILIPTVVDGKRLTEHDAIEHYKKTGENFGKFSSEDAAERYDSVMHARMRRQAETGDGSATLSELLDEVRLRTESDPELRQRTEERVRQQWVGQREEQRLEKEMAASQAKAQMDALQLQIKNTMDQAPRRLTYEQVVPQSIRNVLPESVEKAQRDYWKQITEKGKVETDLGAYYSFLSLASVATTNPQVMDRVLKTNLMEYVNKLDPSDFKHLVEIQTALRKGDLEKSNALLDGYRTPNEIISDTMMQLGLDPTPKPGTDEAKRLGLLRRTVEQRVADLERPDPVTGRSKKASRQDVQGIVDGLTITGTTQVPGWIYGTNPSQQMNIDVPPDKPFALTIQQVPSDERIKIEQALSRAGVPESEDLILKMYLQKIRGRK